MANLLLIIIVFGLSLNISAQQKIVFKNVGRQLIVKSVAFSPDGKYLVVGCNDNSIKVWNLENGKPTAVLKHNGAVNSVSFNFDGNYLASASNDSTIKLWNVETWKEVRSLPKDKAAVKTISFSPDGKILASGSYQTIKLFNTKTLKEIRNLTGHASYITSLSFSPDGKYLASGSEDNKVKLWDLKTKEEVRSFDAHTDWVNSLSFSNDSRYLASGSIDKTIRLWDLQSRRKNVPLIKYNGIIKSVSFSPNGKYLASACSDKKIRLWDLKAEKNIKLLSQNVVPNSLAFSPNGNFIASGNEDGSLIIWETETGKQLITIVGMYFDTKDWVAYTLSGKYDGINCNKYLKYTSGTTLNEQFDNDTNYYPGILAEVFGHRQLKSDRIPPSISINSDLNVEVSQKEYTISGKATDQNGVLLVLVNGIKTDYDSGSFNYRLILNEGINIFQIYAYDKAGNMNNKTLTITYKPSLRKDYALIFYESDYTKSNLPDLRGTKKNADSLASILKNKYGFETHIFPNYTTFQIKEILNKYNKMAFTSNDQLLIYFTGHGQKGNSDTTGYLLCAQNTKMTHKEFNSWSGIDSCNHILMVLDACYSGLALSINMIGDTPPKYNPRTRDEYLKELFKFKPSRKALTSGEGKVSIPFDGLSEFTESLIFILKNNKGKLFNILTYNELKANLGTQYLKLESGNFYNKDESDGTFVFINK